MCWFRKKKKKIINFSHRFNVGDSVNYRYKDELNPGLIYDINQTEDGKVTYDIQVGGECPVIVYNIEEDKIFLRRY